MFTSSLKHPPLKLKDLAERKFEDRPLMPRFDLNSDNHREPLGKPRYLLHSGKEDVRIFFIVEPYLATYPKPTVSFES